MNWKIKKIKVSELRENPNNARKLTEKGLNDLEKSILKFGVAEPLVVNTDYVICGGHGRKKILERLKIKEVDCYLPEKKLTKKEFDELGIRLNKNIAGEFDFDILANEFEMDDLIEWGFDESELGLGFESNENEDDVPEVPNIAISKLGDIFEIDGRHRVMCGDSTKANDVERLMDGKKSEILFTSPPYSDMREYNKNKNLEVSNLSDFIKIFYPFCEYQIINLGLKREDNEIIEYWEEYKQKAKDVGYKLLSWNIWDKSEYGCGSVANATAMFNIVHEWIFVYGKKRKNLNLTVENKYSGIKKTGTQRTGKNDSMVKYSTTIRDKSQLKTIYKCKTAFAESAIYKHPAMFPVSFPIEYVKAM
jgi:hypothetical protein